MRRSSNRTQRFAERSEPTEARERLERRWAERLVEEPRLAVMVTGEAARREPIHRWLSYRQGFSPALVRLFVKENPAIRRGDPSPPVLDPFSGSGTCVVECARQGVHALGVEVLRSLVFLTEAKFEREWPPLPELTDTSSWERIAERLERPIHRAALMLAEARRHTAEGKPNRGAKPVAETLADVAVMIGDDLRHPAALLNRAIVGDARRLSGIADESVSAILTSPPYISRYDYARIADPIERVYCFWHEEDSAAEAARPNAARLASDTVNRADADHLKSQISNKPAPEAVGSRSRIPKETAAGAEYAAEAVAEAAGALDAIGQAKSARIVRDYFRDMSQVLDECRRVMRPGGPAWFVVGGARLKDVYVPADLILAELADSSGFEVCALRVARDLTASRRKFGRLGHVAPRESVLVMRRTQA